ncbi:MAG: Rieske (2Fe-2S) protein [Flavobacteriales bacterium]|nr:Rieske (2Fe-2S) protein [Flavobacteriales bacterium]MEB2342659.1 Rieske (2Fe-2S) protein [Flavobacteriia bacterium]
MTRDRIRWWPVKAPQADMATDGKPVCLELGGLPLCLVRQEGRWHAFLDRCPHQGSSFKEGWCREGRLVCPRHQMGFDLHSGLAGNGVDRATVFPVQERADGLHVGLPCKRPWYLAWWRW